MVIDGYLFRLRVWYHSRFRARDETDGRMDREREVRAIDPKKRYGGRSPPAGGLDGLVSYTQKPWFVCVCVNRCIEALGW